MTNLQMLLSVGIPSLLIVLNWRSNNSRFSQIDARFERIERRLDAHGVRFDEIVSSNHVSSNYKDALEMMRSMTALHERLAVVEARQAS